MINWRKLVLELLVVFLGVTGGFVLNNWRDTRKNIHMEHMYIESFIQNIDSNIVNFQESINNDTIALNALRVKLKYFEGNDLATDSVINLINMILYVSKLDVKASTYEDIKFSGNLNLIRHYKLKEKLVSYYNLLDGALYVDGYYNRYFSEMILPFVMEEYSMSEGKFFKSGKYTQRKFFNIAAGYYSMRLQRTNVLKDVLKESEKLRLELSNYLEQEF